MVNSCSCGTNVEFVKNALFFAFIDGVLEYILIVIVIDWIFSLVLFDGFPVVVIVFL